MRNGLNTSNDDSFWYQRQILDNNNNDDEAEEQRWEDHEIGEGSTIVKEHIFTNVIWD